MTKQFFKLAPFVLFIAGLAGCSNSVKPPEKVFQKYEDQEGAKYYSLPPMVANKVLPEEEKTHEVKQVLDEMKHLKVLVLDNSTEGEAIYHDVKVQLDAYIEKKELQEMIRVTRNSDDIRVNIREEEGEIKEILVSMYGNKGFRGITIEGDLTLQNVIEFIQKADFDQYEKLIRP